MHRPCAISLIVESAIGLPAVPDESLYHNDPSRKGQKPSNMTRQKDIDRILRKALLPVLPNCQGRGDNEQELFNWEAIPLEAQPVAAKLPEKRISKKYQQLSSMAQRVVEVVRSKGLLNVVDFCSGGGHLGILLAYLLKDHGVQVSLVENKEESLRRAHLRVEQLGMYESVLKLIPFRRKVSKVISKIESFNFDGLFVECEGKD